MKSLFLSSTVSVTGGGAGKGSGGGDLLQQQHQADFGLEENITFSNPNIHSNRLKGFLNENIKCL